MQLVIISTEGEYYSVYLYMHILILPSLPG